MRVCQCIFQNTGFSRLNRRGSMKKQGANMKSNIKKFWLGAVAVALALNVSFAATAQAQYDGLTNDDEFDVYADYYGGDQIRDPFEPLNRGIFKFNEVVDTIIMRPVAKGYVAVVPKYGRQRVTNVVANFGEPVNMLNGFLQGNPKRGFTSLWRFIFNSTLGVAGIFDFAGHNFNLVHADEDFGQTMGVYGMGSGPYIVLPFLGPSSGRDAVGRVVDVVTNPFNHVDSDEFVYGRIAVTAVDARARNLDLLDEIYRNSVDPYATIRSAYAQRRAAQIRNNEPRDGAAVAY